jgi:hypothetical protein
MCRDYYTLQFMDPSVDTAPIAPALAAFFDDVLETSVSQLNFKTIVDGLGAVLFEYPFQVLYLDVAQPASVLKGHVVVQMYSYRSVLTADGARRTGHCAPTFHVSAFNALGYPASHTSSQVGRFVVVLRSALVAVGSGILCTHIAELDSVGRFGAFCRP